MFLGDAYADEKLISKRREATAFSAIPLKLALGSGSTCERRLS